MARIGASYGGALAFVVAALSFAAASNQTEAGAPRQPSHLARTAAAPWCWKRLYGSSCRTVPRQTRGAHKKPDPQPMLMIGVGF